ncbi:hypothetical protein CHU92_03930 [Flavobacterium cyanobacteriorum]|uniref:MafI family immunity protein n=1 Tax=Flavobacterium cyanobacteriorum TaxID=2022802 RepID=A0A255ZMN3_9FLAO|nr:hypothetical protein [Flavobacterium cyanobacteriorum]OYQ42662.1 hypothetical protein CHU92_03930 [Flavobacterium cyanobacteriorum]
MNVRKVLFKVLLLVPDEYKSNRQYTNAKEFIEHYEPELALESFIELVDETEGSFSNEFWLGLIEAAEKMHLNNKIHYLKGMLQSN